MVSTTSFDREAEAHLPFFERPSVKFLATSFEARKKLKTPERPKPVPVDKLPAHSPESKEQFLLRLKTFADIKAWTPKPAAIGDVQWARYGWAAVSDGTTRDTCFCANCGERVVVKMTRETEEEPDEKDDTWWHDDFERQLVEKYRPLIKDGHEEFCYWRNYPCKEDIYAIRMADPNVWQPAMRERYFSLTAMEDALPDNIVFPVYTGKNERKKFDLDTLLQKLPEEVLEIRQRQQAKEKENAAPAPVPDPLPAPAPASGDGTEATEAVTPAKKKKKKDPPPPVNRKAFSLATCGWYGQSISGINIVHCKHCFQRCGLWLYQSPDTDTASKSSKCLLNTSSPMVFNPVDLHREHCPWKNSKTQGELGIFKNMSAWQVQANLLKVWMPPPKWKTPYELEEESDDEIGEYDPNEPIVIQTWQEREEEERELDSKMRKIKKMFSVRKAGKRLTKKRSRPDLGRKSGEASRPGTKGGA